MASWMQPAGSGRDRWEDDRAVRRWKLLGLIALLLALNSTLGVAARPVSASADRDGDGIADVVEGGGDADGDGIPNDPQREVCVVVVLAGGGGGGMWRSILTPEPPRPATEIRS